MVIFKHAFGEHTMKALFKAVTLLLMSLPAITVAQGRQVDIFTFEDASCAAWMKSSGNKGLRAQYEFWVRGFVSGHNYGNQALQVKIGVFPGSDALYQYLDQYCRDNSALSFVGGAIKLVEELREPVTPVKQTPAKPAPAKKEPAKAAPAAKESNR
jgi:hypothetical protein